MMMMMMIVILQRHHQQITAYVLMTEVDWLQIERNINTAQNSLLIIVN